MAGRAVSVEWLGGTNLDGRVAVRWMTSDESIELAFRVERQDADTGRFAALLPDPLPARGSPRGAIYTLADPGTPVGVPASYRLVALLDDTNTIAFGPYSVLVPVDKLRLQSKLAEPAPATLFSVADPPLTDFELQRNQERQAELVTVQAMLAASAPGARTKMTASGMATLAGGAIPFSGAGTVQRLKIGVMTAGVYRLSSAYLAAAFNLPESDLQTAIATTNLALSSQGRDVAWAADTNASALLFYGIPAASRYTTENIYWLSLTNGFNLLPRPTAPAASADTNQTFPATLHFESSSRQAYASSRSLDGPFVVGGIIYKATVATLPFTLVEVVRTNSTATVSPMLISRMSEDAVDTHLVGVRVNGTTVTNVSWDGERIMTPLAGFAQTILSNGVNTLLLTNAIPTIAGLVLYVGFDVNYWRTYRASADKLGFIPSGNATVTTWGFTNGPPAIWDVTDPYMPTWIEGATTGFTNGAWLATFAPGAPTNRFFACSPAGYLAPSRVKAEGAVLDLCAATNGADWVVVIPPLYRLVNFRGPAERLAAWRAAQGLKTLVLDYEDLCDAFRYGLDTPFAIRDFVGASALWSTPPRFLTLGGHGDYDYLWSITNQCLIPPYMVPSVGVAYSEGGGFNSADAGLVDADGDGMPDLAVGRIPAVTSNEMERFVDKVIAYEAPSVQKMRVEVIADDPQPVGNTAYPFDAVSTVMAACVPTNIFTVFTNYLPAGSSSGSTNLKNLKTAVTNNMWNGVGLMSFFGHANWHSLGNVMILDSDYTDLRWPFPAIGMGLSCFLNRYEWPGNSITPSFGEVGVLASNKAFSAFFSCSGPADAVGDQTIGEGFFASMFVDKAARLGEATQTAIRGYWSQLMRFQYMVEMYTLLGDPGQVLDQKRLTISSSAGQAWPAVGSNWIGDFTNLACAVTNGALTQGTTQLVCTGWSGAGSAPASGTTTNTGVFFVTQDTTVNWLWKTQYLVTASADSNGAVWGSTGWVDRAAGARLTAVPSDGYRFLGWTGAVVSTNNPLNLVVTGAVALAAAFTNNAPDSWTITAFAGAHGAVNPAGGIQVDSNGASFAITPDVYYHVADLTVDGVSVGAATNYAFSAVAGNHTLAAAFALDARTLNIAADRGQGDPSAGSHAVDYGAGLAARLTNSVVYEGASATQYVCAGWTRTGSAPAAGTNAGTGLFTITNDTTVAWLWRTNVFLNVTAGDGGSVDTASGWRALGSSVTITATPSAHYDFNRWEGDTNAAVSLSSNRATFVMTRARGPLTAVFSPRHYMLTIGAQPYGTPDPAAGVTTNDLNAVLRCGISGSPVELAPQTTQFVCLGWTGAGSVPASGAYTSTVFRMTADSTLDWRWTTNYWLSCAATGPGTIATPDGWRMSGTTAELTAVPSAYHHVAWSGDLDGSTTNGNTLSLNMTRQRAVTAVFTSNDWYALTVASAHGACLPAPGALSYEWGTSLSAGLTNATVYDGLLATQYVSLGWSGSGSAPASGNGTNTGSFTITNDTTVEWLWTTNLYLATTVTGTGTVDLASGWQALGSNVTLTATAGAHWHFVEWLGDTNDGVVADAVLTLPMDHPRAVTANFALDQHTLAVTSPWGQSDPAPGVYTNDYGSSVSVGVTNAPYEIASLATQLVCAGWSGSGSAPVDGTDTNTGSFTITNDTTVEWLWTTNLYLATTVTGTGTVDLASGWQALGSNVTLTATAGAHWHFLEWTGDIEGGGSTGAVLSVPMDHPRAVTANFALDQYTLSVNSPWGQTEPAPGVYTNDYATLVSVGVTNTPYEIAALATQLVSVGWAGTGSAPASGTGTNTGFFALTNAATVNWLWTTNLYLTPTVTGTGTVDVVAGWRAFGSNVTLTATVGANWHFVKWSGDTNGGAMAGAVLSVPMDHPRAVTANFALDQYTLSVNSPWGQTEPAPGVYTNDYATLVSVGVTNTPYEIAALATQLVSVGWAGTGSAPTSGTDTNTGFFALTNAATVDWLWNTNLYLAASVSGFGTLDVASGWQPRGTTVVVRVTPDYKNHLVGWSGDTNGCALGSNSIAAPMTSARRIEAMVETNSQQKLTVVSDVGQSEPLPGLYEYDFGSEVAVGVTNAILYAGLDATQYVSLGWSGSGSAPASGVGTNTGNFNLTLPSVVTWLWRTNYHLGVNVTGGGTTDLGTAWEEAGTTATVHAVADPHWHFACWSGDLDGATMTGAVISVVMDRPRALTAVFTSNEWYTFTIASAHGACDPAPGATSHEWGASLSAALTNATVYDGVQATQYVGLGWSGTGSAPVSGNTTNTGSFAITNDTTVEWRWTTNVYLVVAASGTGSVDAVSGWRVLGSNVVLNAAATTHWHFVEWLGDTNGATLAGTRITLPMDGQRSVTANFALDRHALAIESAWGGAEPQGVLTNDYGAELTLSVTNSPLEPALQATQYVCAGWSASGLDPATGIGANSGPVTVTNDGTLIWAWTTNLWLSVSTNGPGTVDVVAGWQAFGSNVTLTATAGANWHFFEWTGDIAGGASTGAVLSVPMDHPRAVTANFALDHYTLSVTSPWGQTEPAPGIYTNGYGATVSVGVTNTPYELAPLATQLVSLGWTGTGSAPAAGTETNTASFTLTNDTTVSWLWSTNLYLTPTVIGTGTVDVLAGWRALGSNVTLTATAGTNWHFVKWSGDTNGGMMAGATLSVPMDHPRAVTANFAWDQYTLSVNSPWGQTEPAPGVYTNDYATLVSVGVTNTPYELAALATQLVSVGWAGTGSAPTSGTGTNSGLFALTNTATVDWLWNTNLYLAASVSGFGTPDVASGWQPRGTTVVVRVTPDYKNHLVGWSGDTNGCALGSNSIAVPMTSARRIEALVETNSQQKLTVISEVGQTEPLPGMYEYDFGSEVAVGVTNTVLYTGLDATQYVSLGWSGRGSAPASGVGTNTGNFNLTLPSVVTWLWRTNYHLGVNVTGGGTTDLGTAWEEAGTTATVHAVADPHWHFACWSGDLDGATMTGAVISVVMDRPRALTAVFTSNEWYTFTIASAHGACDPAPGATSHEWGTSLSAGLTNATVYDGVQATQYVSLGWSGTGSAPVSGNTTNTGSFMIANDTTVEWRWTTNVYLVVAASGTGSVDALSGWRALGSNVVLNAAATTHWHFVEWLGDTNGATLAGTRITLPMDGQRSVTARFTNDTYTLTVMSDQGVGVPAAGVNTCNWGTVVSAVVTQSPVYAGVLATQYVCAGWARSGSLPASGLTTNAGSFAITNDTTLTWLWKTNYYLALSVEGNGGVNQTSRWCMLGSNVVVLASNDLQHVFLEWSGDTNGCGITNNRLTAAMNQSRRIVARFDAVTAEAYIPGANAATSSVPMYQNNLSLYPIPGHYNPNLGMCFATFVGDILGYWDRNTYTNNGILYWNLVDHGVAPLRQPVAAGQEDADVGNLVVSVGKMYYVPACFPPGGGWDDVVIRQQCNTNLGLAFGSKLYPGQTSATNFNEFVTLYTQIVAEIDVGRAVGAGFYGSTYFGGINRISHQVPVLGYVRMSNIVDSLLYIHLNKDTNYTARSEYVNYFAASSGSSRDMVTIVPGGIPVDAYHRAGIGTNAATAAPLNPDDQYNFRQTHCFTSTADAVWIALTNLTGRQYTVDICHRGTNADTLLTLLAGDGQTVVAQGSTQLTWRCWTTGANYLVIRPGPGVANGAWAWANFDVEVDYTNVNPWLVVASPVGGTWPAVGTNTGFTNGAVISASVTNSPFTAGGGTQYVCAGWTRGGSAPGSGTGVAPVAFTLTNDTTLAWQWTTNLFLLVQTADGPGVTDPTNGWFQAGTNTPVTAQPGDYYHFVGWSGDTNGIVPVSGNQVIVPMTVPRVLTASFQPNLAANQTPEWWLVAHGLTNGGFDVAAMSDTDGDGMPNWAECRAGTDPTNRLSLLIFDNVAPAANSAWIVMRWQSVEGKSYRLARGANLTDQASFSTLVRTNIVATPPMNVETDKTAVGEGPWFYRIDLE